MSAPPNLSLKKLALQLGISVTGKSQDQLAAAIGTALGKPLLPRNTRKPMIVLTFDDSTVQDGTVVIPLLNSLGVKGNFAVIANTLSPARIPDYVGYAAAGHEIMSHSLTHLDQTTLSLTALDNDMKTSRDTIRSWGIPCNNYVYPYGAHNAQVREVARRYYRSAAATAGSTITPPVSTFSLPRYAMTIASGTTALYRSWADDVLAKNGMAVILIHPSFDFDATQQANFTDFVNYAKGLGISFVTMSQALDVFGNQLESGDVSGTNYTVIDRDGNISSPNITSSSTIIGTVVNKLADGITALDNNTPPSAFPNGKISWYAVDVNVNPAFVTGGTSGGAGIVMVERVRNTTSDALASWDRQVFYDYYTNNIWTRRGTAQATWGAWSQVNGTGGGTAGTVIQAVNYKTAADLYTAYTSGVITVFPVNSSGGTGFPTNGAGTVYTDRSSGSTASGSALAWIHQTFYDYYTDAIYQRRVNNTDGTWTSWVRLDVAGATGITQTANYLASTAPNAFAAGKSYYSQIGGTAATADSAGVYPVAGAAGTLVTESITAANGATRAWTKQYWWQYNASEMWFRTATSDTVWGAWERIVHSPSAPVTASLDFPSIAANSQASLTITVTGAAAGDNVVVNPTTALEAGLAWNAGVYSANTVTVTVSNLTAAAIDPAARSWKATVLR